MQDPCGKLDPFLLFTLSLLITFNSANFSGAPDVPNDGITLHRHSSVITVNEDSVTSKLAPPTIGELAKQSRHQPIKITLKITLLDSLTVQWDSILIKEELFVHIPNNTTDNSKEAFIALLEFAEEELCCKKVIVYFDKAKSNRSKSH